MSDLDRKTYLGGSDIAAVLGLGASYGGEQATAFTVWQKKMGESEDRMDPADRLFLERRKRWEPVVRQMLTEEFSAEITEFNRRYVDPAVPHFAAEVDFEWKDPTSGEVENGEIKTVSTRAFGERFGWGEEGSADVPVHYAAQCMWGLMVTGRRKCVLAAMVGLDDIVFYTIERDEETISGMREAALDFWENHVLAKEPPPAQTWRDMQRLMLRKRERPAQLSAEAYAKLQELARVRAVGAAAEEEGEELAFALGEFVCQAWDERHPYVPPAVYKVTKKRGLVPDELEDGGLYYDGRKVGSWAKQTTARLDAVAIKTELPEVAAKYTKPSTTRVLRISKPKA